MELFFVVAGEVVPGEGFVGRALTLGIKGGIEVVLFEGVEIKAVTETLVPGIEAGAVSVGGFEGAA
ncbi:MAG: hypothetical protein AMJ78_04245 [Omnitrophica WOR_2 bacterium SM23_29]|nr:MAG: hypothetical protein AMJ78_04245 [Omnitrophica WOR_2 bacterium SM23_29]